MTSKPPSQLSPIINNVIVLASVLLLHANLGAIVFYYWIENLVHGIFFLAKLYLAVLHHPQHFHFQNTPLHLESSDWNFLILLSFHYFAFTWGQYEGIHQIIGQPPAFVAIIAVTVPMIINHYFAYQQHYLKPKIYLSTTPEKQMFKAYQRVILSTLWIMGSLIYLGPGRSSLATAIGIIGIKTLLDMISYKLTHLQSLATS